jgi:starvation-inducible DNA-binding protein
MTIAPHIGLPEDSRSGLSHLLATILADTTVLASLTRNAHWNVTGPHFAQLHELFGTQYDALDSAADDIAERIRALGHPAPGSLSEFLQLTTIKELPGAERKGEAFVERLLEAHEAICRNLRTAIAQCDNQYNDPATSDFLTGLLESHEKTAWFLRAHLIHS